jgi:DNA-binding HxlR family transcriptional regulator
MGDTWTLLVIRDMLFYGKQRFAEFLDSPEGIATNILTERLRRLEQCGIVEKRQPVPGARRFEYQLTSRGRALEPVLRELIAWGKAHVPGTARRPPATLSRRARDRRATGVRP